MQSAVNQFFFFLQLFDKIKLNQPNVLNKIKLISGNLTSDELGISIEDQV